MTNYIAFDRYVMAIRGGVFNIETEDSIIRPRLSPRERRFEWWRQTIGLFAGPVIFLILYLIPTPSLSKEGHVLGAILGLVITFWISEAVPIPVTALLGAVLCVILGVAPAKTVFAPFADPIIFLFVGSFIIARAMSIHKLDRRFALYIFSIKEIGGNPSRILIACGGVVALISMWISNTAATAIMLPICVGIIRAISKASLDASLKYRAGVMLMIAYGASIGGIATPVGSPPNLIAMGMIESIAHYRITFFQWMALGVPLLIIMFITLSIILRFLHPPPEGTLSNTAELTAGTGEDMGIWSRGEVYTLVSFCMAIVLWILPGVVAALLGVESDVYKSVKGVLDEGVVALLAASLLFVLPIDWGTRTFAMTWDQAVKIDWGTIMLFGGGLSLGKLMFDTGVARVIGARLTELAGVEGLWGVTALSIVLGILVSEATSNTASASMVIPVMIAVSQAAGVSPIPPALGGCLGASFGFMLPVSTPPNAIVYGSGMVPILSMVRAGILFDILGFFIIWSGLRILCPLLGLI